MSQKWGIFLLMIIAPAFAHADEATLVTALQNTYSACVGIDEALADLKKMAGINTAITGVGTGLGAGATIVGIVKESTDRTIDDLLRELAEMEDDKDIPTDEQVDSWLKEYHANKNAKQSEIGKLTQKSKSLGHWRTGLLAGNTATNVAGAIIAGKNTTDGDLQNQIDSCKNAIGELRRARAQARIEGIDTNETTQILNACEGFETVDISKINTRAHGSMISSAIGAATGLSGTITSAVANSDSVRSQKNADGTRTDKEKNLNTASNVLAGASTVASGVATVFNATQISAIKKVAEVAAKCTEALK